MSDLEIFLVAVPGLERPLAAEAREAGFDGVAETQGGVTLRGGWPDVWRANLVLRGASRVLVRLGGFRAMHLAQLDKRSRKFPWGDVLRPDVPVRVEATSRASKIYHAGAAAARVERALNEELGIAITPDAALRVMVRIEDDLVTFSLDTSGEALHRRDHKLFVGKAPMRENMAAMFLREAGFTGNEPVLDPMCGSGTFVIEAAEIAAGLAPGRSRAFAFQTLANFDPAAWEAMKTTVMPRSPAALFHGSDRDDGAIRGAGENAARAGVGDWTRFARMAAGDIAPPEGPPGLVIVNPPYGGRIGNRKLLFALHGALGQALKSRFHGWRVALVTNDAGLAKATALPFSAPGPHVAHGGLKVRLWQTDRLR